MNLEKCCLDILVHDLKHKKPSEQGHFLEFLILLLPNSSRQALCCTTGFFYRTVAPEFAGRFSFEVSAFDPPVLDPTQFFIERCETFCGLIISHNRSRNKTTVLATPKDFKNIEANINLQVVGKTLGVKGGLAFRIHAWHDGCLLFERIFCLSKTDLRHLVFYFVERLDDFLAKDPPIFLKRKKTEVERVPEESPSFKNKKI